MAFKRYSSNNRNLTSILASFLVIVAGMGACLLIAYTGDPTSLRPSILALAAFCAIATVPMMTFRPDAAAPVGTPSVGLWTIVKRWFQRRPRRETRLLAWKRKRTDFVSQPHGHEYVSSFRPERQAPEPKRKG